MRFCGNCGAPVGSGVRVTGVCGACGTPIAPSGDVLDPESTPATLYAVHDPAGGPPPPPRPPNNNAGTADIADVAAGPRGPSGSVPSQPYQGAVPPPFVPIAPSPAPRWPAPGAQPSPRPRRTPRTAVFAAVLGGAVLLIIVLVVLANGPRHGLANGQPAATVAPTVAPTATISPTQTPVPATPTAAPTASPTPDGPPALVVDPTHPALTSACPGASAQFTVSNSGGGTLNWTATSPDDPLYVITPASGTLAAGDPPQTVTVSNIAFSGTVIVADPNATNSPQTVTITCG